MNFTSINVEPNYGAQTATISWEMDDDYTSPVPQYVIRRSPNGQTNITVVTTQSTTDPVIDSNFFVQNQTETIHYQVCIQWNGQMACSPWTSPAGPNASPVEEPVLVIETNDNDTETVEDEVYCVVRPTISEAECLLQAGSINKQQFGMVRKIAELEWVDYVRSGVEIAVLTVDRASDRCPDCTDPDTGQTIGCSSCYGTSYEGGYDQWNTRGKILNSPKSQEEPVGGGEGKKDDWNYVIRMLGDPPIRQDDVLVIKTLDHRLTVQSIEHFEFQGVKPVVIHCNCVIVNRGHLLYEFPVV